MIRHETSQSRIATYVVLRVFLFAFFGIAMKAPAQPPPEKVTLMATGASLMPGWGLYPNGEAYGGVKPLGGFTAWLSGRLTWVADFPSERTYQVWVRKYGGYGTVSVAVDETPVSGGKGGPGGGWYVWQDLGETMIAKGRHHVDIKIAGSMFDAVLFTTDTALQPQEGPLPESVKAPVRREPRRYRDDSRLRTLAGKRRYVVAEASGYEEHLNDVVPASGQVINTLKLWGSANQYITASFTVRALERLEELTVSLQQLTGPKNVKISSSEIDLRVVYLRKQKITLFDCPRRIEFFPDLLLRDDRTLLPPKGKQGGFGGGSCATSIPSHENRQFWITAHIPAASSSGLYKGVVQLQVKGGPGRDLALPVEIEVLPIALKPVEGYYSIYYPAQPVDPKQSSYVTPERYLAELKDQVRHGLNAVTLYGGFGTLKYAKEAGMTEAPCLMRWPDGGAELLDTQVKTAKEMGFADLYYDGVDEPAGDRIEVCRKEAERRIKAGLHMFTAINSGTAQEATKDFIDRPVYCTYVFSGKDNPAVKYVRDKGFRPVSYWITGMTFPLHNRALAGLYNTACGYLGTSPWSYQDVLNNEIYSEKNTGVITVSYPDEFGNPIPSLRWEAYRDGVDDVRYLQALDRATARAEEQLKKPNPPAALAEALAKAKAVRKTRFDSIGGPWFHYLCALQPGVLETTRRMMAEATVEINRQIGSPGGLPSRLPQQRQD